MMCNRFVQGEGVQVEGVQAAEGFQQLVGDGTQVLQTMEDGSQVLQTVEDGSHVLQQAEDGSQILQTVPDGSQVLQYNIIILLFQTFTKYSGACLT